MPDIVLGLDAGGSGTKWHLRRGETTVAQGRVGPLTTLLLGTPQGAATLGELQAALPVLPVALHAGLPGLTRGSSQAQQVAAALGAALHLPKKRVFVESDLDLAFRAHLLPGQGLLLYAGTGSIAYARAEQGQVFRAGGRGYRIGDDGGAASLGRSALRWVTDALDVGALPPGALADEVRAVTGSLEWDELRAFVYGSPGASALAALAPAVSRAAQGGDVTALGLLRDAARSLAELAGRLRQQAGRADWGVVATGGMLRSMVLQEFLREALPGVVIQFRPHEVVASALAAQELAAGKGAALPGG